MRTHTPLAVVTLAIVTAAVGVSACGAAPGPMAPKAALSSSAPASAEEAAGELDRAEGDISRALGATAAYASPPGTVGGAAPQQPPAASPPPPPAPEAQPSHAAAGEKAGARAEQDSGPTQLSASDPCTTACNALASMTRAVTHLCLLAGSTDPRCASAHERVQNASARVHAACPTCMGQ